MTFFQEVKKSIFNPSFYRELMLRPMSRSFKYFFLFILFVALFQTAAFSLKFLPQLKPFFTRVSTRVMEYYPNNLEIRIRNGEVSSNVEEPYAIRMPNSIPEEGDLRRFENLLIIDTENDFSLERFENYSTACWLTRESLACTKDDGVNITSLRGVSDVTIDKESVSALVGRIEPLLKFIYPVFIIGTFIASFSALSLRLVYLLFGALLILIVAKIKRINLGYKKSYQLGLYLMTLPILATTVWSWILWMSGRSVEAPFLFSIILIISAAINLRALPPAVPVVTELQKPPTTSPQQ